MKKTKILGIVVLVIALVAMLANAVFAANVVSLQAAEGKKVGEEVNITVQFPMPVDGAEYKLVFDPEYLEYTGTDTVTEPGVVKVAYMGYDFNTNEFVTKESSVHTFKALKAGETKVSVEVVDLTANQGITVAEPVGSEVTVKIEEAAAEPTPDAPTEGTQEPSKDGDKTITSLKDAKTGFDIMTVILPVIALVAIVGAYKFIKRK